MVTPSVAVVSIALTVRVTSGSSPSRPTASCCFPAAQRKTSVSSKKSSPPPAWSWARLASQLWSPIGVVLFSSKSVEMKSTTSAAVQDQRRLEPCACVVVFGRHDAEREAEEIGRQDACRMVEPDQLRPFFED